MALVPNLFAGIIQGDSLGNSHTVGNGSTMPADMSAAATPVPSGSARPSEAVRAKNYRLEAPTEDEKPGKAKRK